LKLYKFKLELLLPKESKLVLDNHIIIHHEHKLQAALKQLSVITMATCDVIIWLKEGYVADNERAKEEWEKVI